MVKIVHKNPYTATKNGNKKMPYLGNEKIYNKLPWASWVKKAFFCSQGRGGLK